MAERDRSASSSKTKRVRVVVSQKTTRLNPAPVGATAAAGKLAPASRNLSPLDFDKRILAHVLLRQLAMIGHPDSGNGDSAQRYVADFRRRFAPRDVMEEMLFGQLLVTHARVLQLCHLASNSQDMIDVTQFNAQADRAVECFQSHLQVFMAYRGENPDGPWLRAPAEPELVADAEKHPKMTTEQGLPHEKTPLPIDSKGLTVTSSGQRGDAPVDEGNRPQVVVGQEDMLNERVQDGGA